MVNNYRKPASNSNEPINFLLRGASKRRSLATMKAKMIQYEQGIAPRLIAVK